MGDTERYLRNEIEALRDRLELERQRAEALREALREAHDEIKPLALIHQDRDSDDPGRVVTTYRILRAALSEHGLSDPASDAQGEAARSAGREPAERETLPMNPNEEAH